jgi:hypothetical protein
MGQQGFDPKHLACGKTAPDKNSKAKRLSDVARPAAMPPSGRIMSAVRARRSPPSGADDRLRQSLRRSDVENTHEKSFQRPSIPHPTTSLFRRAFNVIRNPFGDGTSFGSNVGDSSIVTVTRILRGGLVLLVLPLLDLVIWI